MSIGSQFVGIIVIVEATPVHYPGLGVVVLVAHHADVDGVEVLDQVLEAHPEHAVVTLHDALDLQL